MNKEREESLLQGLVQELCEERGIAASEIGELAPNELWPTFRALVNTREPVPASPDFLRRQDELLQGLIAQAGVHGIDDAMRSGVDDRLYVWQGDITTLEVDAIVNAANSQMLGCWRPGHHCIDNAIHTFAGVQLRLECARLMDQQGHGEPTGQAKITGAYNLPAKFVIHTVGPIANGMPSPRHRVQLASSYRSCLDLAQQNGVKSLAFCCISTGVFGFPQQEAAQIAVQTVQGWLASEDSDMQVVFNVFLDDDLRIYRQLLKA